MNSKVKVPGHAQDSFTKRVKDHSPSSMQERAKRALELGDTVEEKLGRVIKLHRGYYFVFAGVDQDTRVPVCVTVMTAQDWKRRKFRGGI